MYAITAMDFDLLDHVEEEDVELMLGEDDNTVPMREVRTSSHLVATLIFRCFDPSNAFLEVLP